MSLGQSPPSTGPKQTDLPDLWGSALYAWLASEWKQLVSSCAVWGGPQRMQTKRPHPQESELHKDAMPKRAVVAHHHICQQLRVAVNLPVSKRTETLDVLLWIPLPT